MNKTDSRFLGIKSVGLLEFLVVMYPILSAYYYGISLGTITLTVAAFVTFLCNSKFEKNKYVIIMAVFIAVHELFLAVFLPGVPQSFINATIEKVLDLILVLMLVPHLRYERFYGALMIVTIVCMGGMAYHLVQVLVLGQSINTIPLPFLPRLSEESHMWILSDRPRSFFLEPSSYATFMLVPLSFTLMNKKILMAVLITLFTMASTSTNGFVLSVVVWGFYLIYSRKLKASYRVLIVLMMIAIGYFVTNSSIFEAGFNKIETTDYSDNVRVTAGFNFFKKLGPEEQLLGIVATNPFEYAKSHPEVVIGYNINMTENALFLPTFWLYAIKLGYLGIIIYLMMFWQFHKNNDAMPYLIATLFGSLVQSLGVVFPLITLFMLCKRHVETGGSTKTMSETDKVFIYE